MKELFFEDADRWREWLENNYDKENEVWLIFNKVKTGKSILKYENAVEEALCFGWIDSLIKTIDEKQYARKFHPRLDKSQWSELNKKRVARLIKANKMTPVGMAKIEAARRNGMWEKKINPPKDLPMPEQFFTEINKHPAAKQFYNTLAPSYKKSYIMWIATAKQEKTRNKRIAEAIKLLAKKEKLGLK